VKKRTTAARRKKPAAAKKKRTTATRRKKRTTATRRKKRTAAAAKKKRTTTTRRKKRASQRLAAFRERMRNRRAGNTTASRRGRQKKATPAAAEASSWVRFNVTYSCGDGCLRGYKLGRLMGEGLSGSVFASKHPKTGAPVAVKVYPVGVPIPGRWCTKLRHGANTVGQTGCTGKVRVESKSDFDTEVRVARLMSRHKVGPGLVDAWIAKDGSSTLDQTAKGSARGHFPIGVIVTNVWDMSLSQYQKKVSRRLSGDNYAVAKRKLEEQTRAVDKAGYFNYDLRPDNVLVRVRGSKIVDLTLADYGGLDKKRGGDDNFASLRAMLKKIG
jgi:hypothetical protein